MNELLKKLLDQEILTEETKNELEQAITKKINEAIEFARAETTAQVTAELNEKFVEERDILIEALDAKVTEVLKEELNELKEDIERFRDLEAEYAEKLVEAKSEMADQLKNELGELVEKVDAFLEIRLASELEELREDIEAEKKKKFGQKMFEAFVEEYKKYFAGDVSVEGKLNETETRLRDVQEQLEKAERKIAKLERTKKLEEVLSPLSGRQKEIMAAILEKVDTPLLEDAYNTFIGRVLKETQHEKTSEKETPVLAEGKKEAIKEKATVVKTGDDFVQLNENKKTDETNFTQDSKAWVRKLAGI
jgi:DNA repair exonuclease SbcCD ATPase subunit